MKTLTFSPSTQELWTTMCNSAHVELPFLQYGWHALWSQTLRDEWEPSLLIDESDQTVLAPLARLGDQLRFSGGDEISDYLDLIGSEEKKAQMWEKVLEFASTEKITTLTLKNISASSASLKYFQSLKHPPYHAEVKQEDTTPLMVLPATWEDYLTSLNGDDRHEIRRKFRKFERTYENISIVKSTQPEKDITMLLEMMRHDPDKQSFLTPQMEAFFRQIPVVLPTQTALYTLVVKGEPAATILSFLTSDSFLLYNSGFDARFSGAGFYLKANSILLAIEARLKTYNFLQGNERYKYDLGGKDQAVYTITLTRR